MTLIKVPNYTEWDVKLTNMVIEVRKDEHAHCTLDPMADHSTADLPSEVKLEVSRCQRKHVASLPIKASVIGFVRSVKPCRAPPYHHHRETFHGFRFESEEPGEVTIQISAGQVKELERACHQGRMLKVSFEDINTCKCP